jgi:hypothetical protein
MRKVLDYFYLLMAFVYILLGAVFIFTSVAVDSFPLYRTPVGILLITYALFRFYTGTKKLKQKNVVPE